MAGKGPQKYPGASTKYWFQSKFSSDLMESNVIVWHSTEGTSVPGYDGGSMAPNLTAMPDFRAKKLVWYQHFDFDRSARALVHAGSVATNTLNVCQVEVVGTCDPSTHEKWSRQGIQHLYMADLPDWVVRDLGKFAKWAHDSHGVPLTSGVRFKAYPASYGTSNGVRLSNAKWLSFKGHCGHQHVPSGNVHGDPGAFPMEAILDAASGTTAVHASSAGSDVPEKEDDMQLNDLVSLGDWIPQTWPDDKGLADKQIAVNTALGSTYGHARAAHEGVDAMREEVAALRMVVDQLAAALAARG